MINKFIFLFRPYLAGLLLVTILAGPLIFLFVSDGLGEQTSDAIQPEERMSVDVAASERAIRGTGWMISVANKHAAEAGAKILRAGGNAVDAMVAVQLALTLVEPQSSGLGGGGFLLYWDNTSQKLRSFDARETAPLNINPKHFLDETGKPLRFFDAVVNGRSVGTPGIPKLLHETHMRFGQRPWDSLFDHSISLAEQGFEISPRLAGLIERRRNGLGRFTSSRSYFLDNGGKPKKRGVLLKNPAFAQTLKQFRDEGADAFYKGSIARQIVNAVQSAKGNAGTLALEDLARYQIRERQPVCAPYRNHSVCGMGPPSTGGIAVGQILGMLNPFNLRELGPNSPISWQLIGDATRLAFADRGRYVADEDYVVVPTKGLLNPEYIMRRSELLTPGVRLKDIKPGKPTFDHALNYADDVSQERPSTSHFVIHDQQGNIVSMTSSIESAFGSNIMVGGFLLNNQLTDFSFRTHADNQLIANGVAPGKRPRSSMAPTMVLLNGKPVLALGSPGGSRIVAYVAQALISVIDWDMSLKEAFDRPHVTNRFGTFALEANTRAVELQAPLEEMGYSSVIIALTSGLHGIKITEDGLEGSADPRREGVVLTE